MMNKNELNRRFNNTESTIASSDYTLNENNSPHEITNSAPENLSSCPVITNGDRKEKKIYFMEYEGADGIGGIFLPEEEYFLRMQQNAESIEAIRKVIKKLKFPLKPVRKFSTSLVLSLFLCVSPGTAKCKDKAIPTPGSSTEVVSTCPESEKRAFSDFGKITDYRPNKKVEKLNSQKNDSTPEKTIDPIKTDEKTVNRIQKNNKLIKLVITQAGDQEENTCPIVLPYGVKQKVRPILQKSAKEVEDTTYPVLLPYEGKEQTIKPSFDLPSLRETQKQQLKDLIQLIQEKEQEKISLQKERFQEIIKVRQKLDEIRALENSSLSSNFEKKAFDSLLKNWSTIQTNINLLKVSTLEISFALVGYTFIFLLIISLLQKVINYVINFIKKVNEKNIKEE
jgi:hypothetical protein